MVVPPSKERHGRVTREAFCSVLMTRGVGVMPRQESAFKLLMQSQFAASRRGGCAVSWDGAGLRCRRGTRRNQNKDVLPYKLPGRMVQFARAERFVREQWFVDQALRGGAFPRLQDYTVFRKVEATDNTGGTGYHWKARRIGPRGETFAFQGDPVAGARERPRRGSSVPPKFRSV